MKEIEVILVFLLALIYITTTSNASGQEQSITTTSNASGQEQSITTTSNASGQEQSITTTSNASGQEQSIHAIQPQDYSKQFAEFSQFIIIPNTLTPNQAYMVYGQVINFLTGEGMSKIYYIFQNLPSNYRHLYSF